MTRLYVAGHMLTRGAQLQRMHERYELEVVNPELQFYVPQENKAINDKKANSKDNKLAEKIVKQDTDALFWADTVIIMPNTPADLLFKHVRINLVGVVPASTDKACQ